MNGRKRMDRRGLTMVEVLLASALAALLLAATAVGLVTVVQGVRVNDASLRAKQSGTRTLEYILGKVRRAKELKLLPATATNDEYTTLATLDEATWDSSVPGWSPIKYTFFIVADGKLYAGPDEDVANAEPLLSDVNSVIFRSTPSGIPLKHRDVTVEITLAAPDATGGKQDSKFAIAGNASARCEE